MATDDSGALVILGEIVHVQREYLRDGDPQRMWDELLDALLRTTGSAHGFIAEVDWSSGGMPGLTTRAMVWLGRGDQPVAPHPDIGLLLAQVIADQAPVVLDLGSEPPPDASRFAPISGFLGLPLMSSGRLVGIVGLTSPEVPYDHRWIGVLQPLLATCASIVEAIQSSRDRDAAIAELEQTAAYLQALVNGTTHAVAVVDDEGIVRSANPAAGRLTGIPEADLVGRSLLDLIPAPDRDRARRAVRLFVHRGVPTGMAPVVLGVVGPGGTIIPVEVSIGEMSLDGQRRLVVLGQDISDRLTAQSALARAGEILDATPDLIAWAGPEGSLRYLNKGGRAMLGLGGDDPVDHILLDELTAPEWRDRFVDEVLPQAAAAGSWTGELGYLTSDGSTVPVSLVVLAEPAYTAILARDLSERYEVERIKDGFVSNVSHELRTPLTAVIGYLELLREGSLGELTPIQAEVVDVMGRNGERLLELIGEILQVGAFDADHPVMQVRLDLSALVSDVVIEHTERARDTAVSLVAAIPSSVTVMGDAAELRSAVSNLVANAVKFTPAGGVVEVQVTPRGDTTAIVISDTGIGIPEADLDQVFQRFYRGEHARALQIQGTGLGLAIVEGAVRRHGGTVTVTSTVGIGTTFEMLLPTPPDGDGP